MVGNNILATISAASNSRLLLSIVAALLFMRLISSINLFKPRAAAYRSFATMSKPKFGPPVVMGEESIMSKKAHGTTDKAPQENLKYEVKWETADKICCHNRHYAEHSGYFTETKWEDTVDRENPTEYYDSVTGKLLFTAPKGRTFDQFYQESLNHGWPSFRDEEVNWDYVRILSDGECVSVDGTHLGHNLPDSKGNRYCINLVCVAGNPI